MAENTSRRFYVMTPGDDTDGEHRLYYERAARYDAVTAYDAHAARIFQREVERAMQHR